MITRIGGIIVEGSDQQGKSVFCEKLSRELGYEVHHFSRPKNPGIDYYEEYTAPAVNSSKPLIFDRSYVSEIVYGEVTRGASRVTPEIKDRIEQTLNDCNYVLIYLKRENFEFEDREEMFTRDEMARVMKKYDEVYPTINLPKIQLDAFDADALNMALAFYFKYNHA